MQDPKITIRGALKDGWGLAGDLAVANIKFSTGWYDKEYTQPQVSVTDFTENPVPFELGYGVVRVFCIYQIDVWVTALRQTGKGPGKAKDHKWKMRAEIQRIVKANLTDLTDLEYLILDKPGRSLDEPDRSPPVLRWSQLVSAIYDIT